MTVTSTVRKNTYAGTGTTGPFAYAFKIFVAAHLRVKTTDAGGVVTTLVLNTDYSVAGAGEAGGGTITTTVAVPVGTAISIERIVRIIQETTNLANAGPFYADEIEAALDYLTMIDQQISACVSTLEAQVNIYVDLVVTINEQIDVINEYITNNNADLTDILARLDAIEAAIAAILARLDAIEARLDELETRIFALETAAGGSGSFVNPMTHRGDMISGNVDGVLKRLPYSPMGGAAKFLVARGIDNEDPEWASLSLFGYPSSMPVPPFTPIGGIPYINADGEWVTLSPGNDDDVLTLVDGLPVWSPLL